MKRIDAIRRHWNEYRLTDEGGTAADVRWLLARVDELAETMEECLKKSRLGIASLSPYSEMDFKTALAKLNEEEA